jgi:hypothetical protein
LPNILFTIDAVTASLILTASLWPLTRAGKAIAADCREQGVWLTTALGVVLIVALGLRFFAVSPTLLVHTPDLHHHMERLFDPLGPAARWHPFHGMGGHVVHAGAARLFGESVNVVWTVNRLVDSLTPLLVYLFARRLFACPVAGVMAALLLALFTPQIRLAASEQLASLTVFFSVLAYCAVLEGLARPGRWAYLAAAVALAAAMQQRADVVPHVMFCGLLILLRVRGEPWPRLNRWFFIALGLFVVLSTPRVLASFQTEETFGGWFSLDFFFDLVVSPRRHIYINPAWAWPIYPVLTLVGLGWLAARRQWRLLAFVCIAIVAGWLFYLNQWTLDGVEALRFQVHAWFLFVMMAGFGLSCLGQLPRSRTLRGAILGAGLVAAVGSLVATWPMLHTHTATAQDIRFFTTHLHRVPPGCALHLLRPEHAGKRRYGPGTPPRWALGGRITLTYPADLRTAKGERCRVAYLGTDCHTRYPEDDRTLISRAKESFASGRGPALYTLLDQWQARLDRSPPGQRPGCRWLRRHFRLEPLATATLQPGLWTFVWTPRRRLRVGFYRLHPRPGAGPTGRRRPGPPASRSGNTGANASPER